MLFSSTNGLILYTTIKNSPSSGTAYVINYSFKANTKYDIVITAKGNPDILLKTSVIPNFNQFITFSTTSCIPDAYAFGYNTAGSGQYSTQTAFASANYTIPQFIIPGNTDYPYLIIWASGGRANLDLDALYISKIVITPTAATSFNLTSTPTSISCGFATPVTFTATGTNVPPGATISYLWNLGANNSWLYGGVAAGATISTTSNTLTLTPTCGSVLSSVSATVTVNGTASNTNASTVSIVPPVLSLNGSSSVCIGTSIYTIVGLPCNASVTWDSPPSGVATLSNTIGSSTTLTVGGTSANFNLTANVTSCGSTQTVNLPIHVGNYTSSDYNIDVNGTSNFLEWCPNTTYSFILTGPATNYNWTIPQGWTQIYISNQLCVLRSPSGTYPPTGNVIVSFTDPCGSALTKSLFFVPSGSCQSPSPFTLSPNPAYSYVDIAVINTQTTNIKAIQITDIYGNILFNQTYNGIYTGVQVSVNSMANGNKIARIYDGTQWYNMQFIVQH